MSWGIAFRVRQYLKGSLWFIPMIGAILGPLLAALVRQIDASFTLPDAWQYSPATASTLLTTIVGAMIGLTGFVVTVTVLAIQMATGTFSARYMRIWYRDRMLKTVLAFLIGTLTFSFAMLRRVDTHHVPNLGVTIAGTLVVVSLVLFVLFLDRFIHRLRPVAVAGLVARVGRRVVTEVSANVVPPDPATIAQIDESEPALSVRSLRAGSIQALDVRGLLAWARQHRARVAVQAAVGDFVPVDGPLIEVYGEVSGDATTARRLRGMVVLGLERTIEQDPAFAVRIMVDVAIRALSAAINDPTTAVQVLDHLQDLMRLIGSTELHGRVVIAEPSGETRLILPGRRWEDYVSLAVTEIREYGARSIQVMRRLRAMLEDLRDEVRPAYRPALDEELARLDATATVEFAGTPDLDRAMVRDRQGIGGPEEDRRPSGTTAV